MCGSLSLISKETFRIIMSTVYLYINNNHTIEYAFHIQMDNCGAWLNKWLEEDQWTLMAQMHWPWTSCKMIFFLATVLRPKATFLLLAAHPRRKSKSEKLLWKLNSLKAPFVWKLDPLKILNELNFRREGK